MLTRRLKMALCAATALAAGLALRLWLVAHSARIDGDTLVYGNIARNWLQHGIYGFVQTAAGPLPTLIRLPGYPIFLAICFFLFGPEHYTAVMHIQCFIDLLTCLILGATAHRLFGARAALAAICLSALCPFTATYAAAPLTETLTLFTIALAFYSLLRWQSSGRGFNRWLWLLSTSMAYSLLLRPEQGLLAAAILPTMLWLTLRSPQKPHPPLRTFTPILLAALIVILPLAPWTLRNWRTFHVIQPLAPRYATDPGEFVPFGFQRWYRTWAIDFASTEEVYWNYDSAEIEINDLPTRAFDSDAQYTRTEAILTQYNQAYNATPQLDVEFAALASERIHASPIRYYIALPVARLLNMALRPRTEPLPTSLDWWNWSQHHGDTAFAIAYAALNLAYFILGFTGVWLWHRRGWGSSAPLVWAMLAFLILRSALLLTLDNSEPRYTLEFFPLLIVWASYLFQPQAGTLSIPTNGRTGAINPPGQGIQVTK
jgi:4-amino-4-deoxy-L-arabinose transferase-like glycosyltransferase